MDLPTDPPANPGGQPQQQRDLGFGSGASDRLRHPRPGRRDDQGGDDKPACATGFSGWSQGSGSRKTAEIRPPHSP
jgi:hypothetical protein